MSKDFEEKWRDWDFRNAKHDYERAARFKESYVKQNLLSDAARQDRYMNEAFAKMLQNMK